MAAASSSPVTPYCSESFNLETKLIVLNFIGFNPHDSPSHSIQSADVFRNRFCSSLPVTPELYKHHTHRSCLRKQKTTDHLLPEDKLVSCITKQKLPKRKAKSLETVRVGPSFKFHENVSKGGNSDSELKSPNTDRESLDVDSPNTDRDSLGVDSPNTDRDSLDVDRPDCGKCDNLCFPSNAEHWLQPDLLFTSHKENSTDISPKSVGFKPSLEDWEGLEAALSEGSEPTRVPGAVDELVNPLQPGVVTIVSEGEVTESQRDDIDSVGQPGTRLSHNGFDGEEYPKDFIGSDDSCSSPSLTSSSMSIDNSGPSSQYEDSVTSHEIDSCCCSHAHTPSDPVTPGDRSKLRLHIVNHAAPAVEDRVLNYMRAELSEELSSLESELENAMKKQRNGEHFSPLLTPPLTPQSNAARVLARIGDEVRARYEFQIEGALYQLFMGDQGTFSYEFFRDVAIQIVDHSLPGWSQVVLLLVYGQSVAWRAVEKGHRGIGNLINYTTWLLADHAAEFIINQGGWGAVMNLDSTDSSPDLQTDHPLHSKKFTSQSDHVYQSCAMSIKAADVFPNHQNITSNNSSYHDNRVASIFTDPSEITETLLQENQSQNSSDDAEEMAVQFMLEQISESEFLVGRFQGWDDSVFARSSSEDFWSNILMIGVNVGTLAAIIYLSQMFKGK